MRSGSISGSNYFTELKIKGFHLGFVFLFTFVFGFVKSELIAKPMKPKRERLPTNEERYASGLREACRKEISGLYISLFDQMVHAEEFTESLENNLRDLRKALVTGKLEAESKEKVFAASSYDMEKQTAAETARAHVEHIESKIAESETLKKTTGERLVVLKKTVDSTKSKLEKLFKIEVVKSDIKGRFPFTLHYKSSCPEFRIDCPLTYEDAEILAGIFSFEQFPDSCRRYVRKSGFAGHH